MVDEDTTILNPVRAIDLFCGIGGNSWGANKAGAEIVAGFDMWELAGKVFKDNFPEAEIYPYRLQDINLKRIKNKLGKIDLILASPECTSHSVARGNRDPSFESQNLAYQVLRFAKEFSPRWIVIENVTHMKKWDGYKKFLLELKKLYNTNVQSLLASQFGVPQSRRRIYIVCDREQTPPKIVPPAGLEQINVEEILNMNGKYAYSPLRTEKRAKATLERAGRAFTALGRQEPFLLVYYGSDAAGGWQRLSVPLRTITTVDRFALVKPGDNGDEHVMRMLQPQELKVAMGFLDDFKLERGNRREKIHLLGNAVCPPVMKTIIETLVEKERLLDGRQDEAQQVT